MKQMIFLIFAVLALFMSGCATQQAMYEYGSYSESFYQLKKSPDEKSAQAWKNALEEIIEKSNARAIRIPPGIYANLGYIYLKASSAKNAVVYFEAEKKLYPESAIFMDNLIKKAKLMEKREERS